MESLYFLQAMEQGLLEFSDIPEHVYYSTKSGERYLFDTRAETCSKFGFLAGTRVITPRGQATVIGVSVKEGLLWFHIDGDRGASFWDNWKTYEDMLSNGVTYVPEVEPESHVAQGLYRTKRVDYKGKTVNIIEQNENGPCPLIAIANVLALRSKLEIPTSDKLTVDQIASKISTVLDAAVGNKDGLDKIKSSMNELQYGLDVNFNMQAVDSFENTKFGNLFSLLGIKMVHGWLVDPQSAAWPVIQNLTYNDLTLLLAAHEQEKMDTGKPNANNSNTNSDREKLSSSSKEIERKLTAEEALIVQSFLDTTSHQLTVYGLAKLHEFIQEDELVIFFRNNHFSTLTKHNGKLFNLVTDIGYEKERLIMWDLLASIDGNSHFYNGDFVSSDDASTLEIVNTALAFGFAQDKISLAISTFKKPNEPVKMDDVLAWLNKNYPPQ